MSDEKPTNFCINCFNKDMCIKTEPCKNLAVIARRRKNEKANAKKTIKKD